MRRTKEDAEKTRLRLIDAALQQFSQQGYSRTTLAMIAQAAGVSRGPIYWHFRNKEELYQAVLEVSQRPLEGLVREALARQDDPPTALRAFAQRWLSLLAEDDRFRQSFEILLNKTELTADMGDVLRSERKLTRSMIAMLATLMAAGQARGDWPSTQLPEALALLWYAQLMGITQSWLFAPRLFSLRERTPFFCDRLLALLTLP